MIVNASPDEEANDITGKRSVTQSRKLGKLPQAISIQPLVRQTGEHGVRVQVDFSQVPQPDAYYVADYARIWANGPTVEIIFGKLEGQLPYLRNKLEVKIPAYAFLGQWLGSMEFMDRLKTSMDEKGFPSYTTPNDINELTEKVQTVHANNVLIAGGEGECSIDLYLLPPRDLRFFLEKRESPHLEPLVRILTEGRLLVGLAQKFREIADIVRPYAPDKSDFEQAEEAEVGI